MTITSRDHSPYVCAVGLSRRGNQHARVSIIGRLLPYRCAVDFHNDVAVFVSPDTAPAHFVVADKCHTADARTAVEVR